MDCENCIYGDIADWEQEPKSGQAKPIWWCLKHKRLCEDIQTCSKEDNGEREVEKVLGLYKKWKAKKEKEIADKIRKEMMNSSPRIRVSHPEIVPVNVKVFSLDKAEGMQYVNGNPYMRDTMNEHLAKKLGRQLLESGLVDVEYEQCIDESLCIKAKVEVIKR